MNYQLQDHLPLLPPRPHLHHHQLVMTEVAAADFSVFSVGVQAQLEDFVQGPVDYAKQEETKKLDDLHKFDNGT